jgi:hypothetical protein
LELPCGWAVDCRAGWSFRGRKGWDLHRAAARTLVPAQLGPPQGRTGPKHAAALPADQPPELRPPVFERLHQQAVAAPVRTSTTPKLRDCARKIGIAGVGSGAGARLSTQSTYADGASRGGSQECKQRGAGAPVRQVVHAILEERAPWEGSRGKGAWRHVNARRPLAAAAGARRRDRCARRAKQTRQSAQGACA